jgi:hypothetical protein
LVLSISCRRSVMQRSLMASCAHEPLGSKLTAF